MRRNRKQILALVAALALVLALLAACGGGQGGDTSRPAEPEPIEDAAPPAGDTEPVRTEDDVPETDQTEVREPEDVQDEADLAPADSQPEESEPSEEQAVEPASAPVEPEPEPDSEPAPEPEPEPEDGIPEDGTYTVSVTLEGGTGRASVASPAELRCEGGKFYATVVWSSSNYDYMKVDGERYDPVNTEGNSAFEIPVAAFDQKLDVIADTVAMSEPHEVEYTLYFDSATLQKQ